MKNIISNKLSTGEATTVVYSAVEDVEKSGPGPNKLRFGQAVWNNLPSYMTEKATGTDIDFFYEKDNGKAYRMFIENFVEEE